MINYLLKKWGNLVWNSSTHLEQKLISIFSKKNRKKNLKKISSKKKNCHGFFSRIRTQSLQNLSLKLRPECVRFFVNRFRSKKCEKIRNKVSEKSVYSNVMKRLIKKKKISSWKYSAEPKHWAEKDSVTQFVFSLKKNLENDFLRQEKKLHFFTVKSINCKHG